MNTNEKMKNKSIGLLNKISIKTKFTKNII